MTDWIAVGPVQDGALGYALHRDRVVARATAATAGDVLAKLGPQQTVLRIGEGPASQIPTRVLPQEAVTLPVLEQRSPPDVVGAWVRLWVAGFLMTRENWDGVICVTEGDVTHWMHISADEIVSTQSFLTPRLRLALGGAVAVSETAVDDTISRPERLAARLRQAEVQGDGAAITGYLLGAELAATRPYWLGQQVALLSDRPDAHLAALRVQGVPVTAHDPADLIELGLAAWAATLGLTD